jgi:hypothetical protein
MSTIERLYPTGTTALIAGESIRYYHLRHAFPQRYTVSKGCLSKAMRYGS